MVEDNEVKKDISKRVDDFNVELKGLLKKYSLVLVANPVFTIDGRVSAMPQVIDESDMKKIEQKAKESNAPEAKPAESGLSEA